MILHHSKRTTTIVRLMYNVLILKVFQSFPPKLIRKFEPTFYWRRIFDQHTDKIKQHNRPWELWSIANSGSNLFEVGLLKRGRLELGRSADKKISEKQFTRRALLLTVSWEAKKETRRKQNVSERRTIHDSDGETGRKNGKGNGGAAKRINAVVMHEEGGKRWYGRHQTRRRQNANPSRRMKYRGNWGEQRVGEHWREDERGGEDSRMRQERWGRSKPWCASEVRSSNDIVSSALKERWANGTHEDTERRYEDCPPNAVRETARSLFLQNSTFSNMWRYPGSLIAAPGYDRDRREPPHRAGRESQKTHALGIKTTFRSFRSSGSMSWRILTLWWIATFNWSTLVSIEMLLIEYGFGPPSRKNQRSLNVCGDMVEDTGR